MYADREAILPLVRDVTSMVAGNVTWAMAALHVLRTTKAPKDNSKKSGECIVSAHDCAIVQSAGGLSLLPFHRDAMSELRARTWGGA